MHRGDDFGDKKFQMKSKQNNRQAVNVRYIVVDIEGVR